MGLSAKDFRMVACLLLSAVLVVLNQTLLSPALPSIMADTQVDATTVQWLTSGYALVEAIVIPLSAFVMGSLSTRKIFIGGLVVFLAGTVVAAVSPSFWFLLLGRLLQASATGIIMPATFSVILVIFPREKRGAAMGIVGLVIAFAPAVGPALSGVLVDSVGWRVLFMIVAVLTLLVVVAGALMIYNKEGFEKAGFDILSVCMSSIGLFGVLYGFSTFSSSSNLLIPVALMLVGVVFVGMFVKRQLSLEVPLLRVEVLKARKYRTAVCIIPVLQMVMIGSGVLFPIFIQNALGYSATYSGFAMLPGAVFGGALGMLAGRMYDKHGVRGIGLIGGIVVATGGVLCAFMGDASPILLVAAFNAVMMCGIQLLTTPLNTWGVNSLDNRVIQHATALSNTVNQVGASLGTALIMSLTAMGPVFYPDAPAEKMVYLGCHVAFVGVAAALCLVLLAIVIFVRDKKVEKVVPGINKPPAIAAAHAGVPVQLAQANWTVGDVMNPNSPCLGLDSTVRDAVVFLAKTGTSGFPLVSVDGKVVGFLSDGDIMKYLGSEDANFANGYILYSAFEDKNLQGRLHDLMKLSVADIATMKPECLQAGMPVDEACKMLAGRRIKKMPVVDENGMFVGCMSRHDVIAAMSYYLEGEKPVISKESVMSE